MNEWKMERVSSMDKQWIEKLTEENHLFNRSISYPTETFKEIYGISTAWDNGPEGISYGIEHMFTSWWDEKMKKDENGNSLDLVVYEKDNDLVWEPFVERTIRLYTLNKYKNVKNYRWAYVNGRRNYLGPFLTSGHIGATILPGYQMWEEVTINKEILEPINEQ